MLLTLIALIASCGTAREAGTHVIVADAANKLTTAERVKLSLNVSYESLSMGVFPLADATSFIFSVTGCTSGFEVTNQNSAVSGASVSLYKGDKSCSVSLSSFVWNAKTWTKQGGGSYAGTAAVTFVNNVDSETLNVVMPDNLPSPLTNNVTVSVSFTEIKEGSSKQIVTTGSATHYGAGAYDAPYFKFKSSTGVVLVDVDGATNVATFIFRLECKNALTTSDTVCPTQNAQNQLLTDMKLALVVDNGAVTNWATAQAAFQGAATNVTVTQPDVSAPSGAYNGGFSVQLLGPGALESTRNMLLIVERTMALDADKTYTTLTIDFASGVSFFFLPNFLK